MAQTEHYLEHPSHIKVHLAFLPSRMGYWGIIPTFAVLDGRGEQDVQHVAVRDVVADLQRCVSVLVEAVPLLLLALVEVVLLLLHLALDADQHAPSPVGVAESEPQQAAWAQVLHTAVGAEHPAKHLGLRLLDVLHGVVKDVTSDALPAGLSVIPPIS